MAQQTRTVKLIAVWGAEERKEVTSVEELDRELDDLAVLWRADGHARGVDLWIDKDLCLLLVVGGTYSTLWWQDFRAQSSRACASKGTLAPDGPVEHLASNGQLDFFKPEHAIEPNLAREAAREFVRTGGERPTCVAWQEQ
jgi:Immunity protein Imm1